MVVDKFRARRLTYEIKNWEIHEPRGKYSTRGKLGQKIRTMLALLTKDGILPTGVL